MCIPWYCAYSFRLHINIIWSFWLTYTLLNTCVSGAKMTCPMPYFTWVPATWQHSLHKTAAPIYWSPQCSWWGLLLPHVCICEGVKQLVLSICLSVCQQWGCIRFVSLSLSFVVLQVLTVILSWNCSLSQRGALWPPSVFIATNSLWSRKLFTQFCRVAVRCKGHHFLMLYACAHIVFFPRFS